MEYNYERLFDGKQKENVVIYLYNRNHYDLSKDIKIISEKAVETDFFLKEVKPVPQQNGLGIVIVFEKIKSVQSESDIEELKTAVKILKNQIDDMHTMFDKAVKEIEDLKVKKNKEKENG